MIYGYNARANLGLHLIDVNSGEGTLLRGGWGFEPLDCSSDGEWVLYQGAPLPHKLENTHGVFVISRLSVRTRRSEPYVIAAAEYADFTNIFAPSRYRLFLRKRPSVTNLPARTPVWEAVWAPRGEDNLGHYAITFWYPDSSAVGWRVVDNFDPLRGHLALYRFDEPRSIRRYHLSDEKWVLGSIRPNEVYVAGGPDRSVRRCNVLRHRLSCMSADLVPPDGFESSLLSDGSILSTDPNVDFAYRTLRGRTPTRINVRLDRDRLLHLGSVSPNGRLIVVSALSRNQGTSIPTAAPSMDSEREWDIGIVELDTLR